MCVCVCMYVDMHLYIHCAYNSLTWCLPIWADIAIMKNRSMKTSIIGLRHWKICLNTLRVIWRRMTVGTVQMFTFFIFNFFLPFLIHPPPHSEHEIRIYKKDGTEASGHPDVVFFLQNYKKCLAIHHQPHYCLCRAEEEEGGEMGGGGRIRGEGWKTLVVNSNNMHCMLVMALFSCVCAYVDNSIYF